MLKKITFYTLRLMPLLIIVLLSGCYDLTNHDPDTRKEIDTDNGIDTENETDTNNDSDGLVGALPPMGEDLLGDPYLSDNVSSRIIGYMIVSSSQDGIIDGGVTEAGKENTHAIYIYENKIIIPTDPNTELPTGQRLHRPSKLIIESSQGIPKLYEALTKGNQLTIQIDLYAVNALGENEHIYTINYEYVYLTLIEFNQPNTLGSEDYGLASLISLEFIYGIISITHIESGVTYIDSWHLGK